MENYREDKMRSTNNKTVNLVVDLLKAGTVFMVGGIGIHLLVMIIDYYLLLKPFNLESNTNLRAIIFSAEMIPMMVAYAALSLIIFFLWRRKKKALLFAYEKEVKNEKIQAVFKSMQRLTGILAEHIAFYNTEIMKWVESRKRNGGRVSDQVEKSSEKIAQSLQSLSKLSFVYPYTEKRPDDLVEIEKILQTKLYRTTEIQDG